MALSLLAVRSLRLQSGKSPWLAPSLIPGQLLAPLRAVDGECQPGLFLKSSMRFHLRTLLIVLALGPVVLAVVIIAVMVHVTHNRGHVITTPIGPKERATMERQLAEAELARSRLNSSKP